MKHYVHLLGSHSTDQIIRYFQPPLNELVSSSMHSSQVGEEKPNHRFISQAAKGATFHLKDGEC